MDGLLRREGVLERLLHCGERPVRVRVTQPSRELIALSAAAPDDEAAAYGIERMRFALGLDDELREFHRRFRADPLIGPSVRARPWLRARRSPEPFEALAWAICEQLIEYERAAAIERRLLARLGRSCPYGSGLRDLPTPDTLARVAPARLESFDLAASRSLALIRAAREIARGKVDLSSPDHERAWRRLRAIPGIGSWTVEMLALRGQGRYDQAPAGDLGLLKLVGRLRSGGDPHARASESDVRSLLAPYGEWAGLAAVHLMG